MTDPVGMAVGGIERPRSLDQEVELVAEVDHVLDGAIELAGSLAEQIERVSARDLPVVRIAMMLRIRPVLPSGLTPRAEPSRKAHDLAHTIRRRAPTD